MKPFYSFLFFLTVVLSFSSLNSQALDPDSLTGTYLGMWTNTTYGSSGGALLDTYFPETGASTMILFLDLDGFVGGLMDPDPRTLIGNITSTEITVDTSLAEGDLLLTWSADGTIMWEFTDMTTPGFDHQSGIGTGTASGIDIAYTVWFVGGDSAIGTAELTKMTSSAEQVTNLIPDTYKLYNNFPNPFNPYTTIYFSVPELSNVSVTIYNEIGEKITELLNEMKSRGTYSISFDASRYSSGVYLYNMRTKSFSQTKKMILAK